MCFKRAQKKFGCAFLGVFIKNKVISEYFVNPDSRENPKIFVLNGWQLVV